MNRHEIIGNTTDAPTLRTLESGRQVANVAIAVDEPYRDKDGEWVDRTQFFNVTVWGQRAERFAEIVGKGDRLMVSGRVHLSRNTKGKKEYHNVTLELSSSRHWWKRLQQNGNAAAQQGAEPDAQGGDAEDDDIPF